MKRSETIEKLTEALAAAQALIVPAAKDKQNSHYQSRYADLASVWDACRAPLSSHGLAVIQTTEPGAEGGIVLETMLTHVSGQWISGSIPVACNIGNPQAIGSALTYARRYGLAAIVGVCPDDDDDAEAAVQPLRERQGGYPARNGERGQQRREAAPARAASSPPPRARTPEPTTKEVRRFEETLNTFCSRMNARWLDRHTSDDGVIPGWVKDLANPYQIVGHMLKKAGIPAEGKFGERMKVAAGLWLSNEAAVTKEWMSYLKGLAESLEQQHGDGAAMALAVREPGSDDE